MNIHIKTISENELNAKISAKLDLIKKDEVFYKHLVSVGFNDELIKENISDVIDYFEQYQKCSKCTDVNNCLLGEHYIKNLSLIDGKASFEYDLCHKYKKINRVKNLSYICDIPDYLLAKPVKSIESHSVRKALIAELLDIYSNNTRKLLFIKGKKNNGATYITSLFYKDTIAKFNLTGIYANGPKRFTELANLMFDLRNKAKFEEAMEAYSTVDILVISKISNYNFNEYVRNNILFSIIERRISNNLTTIFTSELDYQDFVTLLDVKRGNDVRYKQLKELLDEFKPYDISLSIKYY